MEQEIVTLKPSEVIQTLVACMDARENLAIVGPPGSGKSSVVNQACAIVQRDNIVCLPPLEDPTDSGGLPWISADHTHAKKVLFGNIYKALNSTVPTNLHLEDFGQAVDAVQKSWMQWAQAREVDGNRLPDHVSITLATNRRVDRAGVTGMLEPIKGRFTLIHMRSDLDDFCNNLFQRGVSEYGLSDEAITVGCAFLRFRPEALNEFKPTPDMTNTPTERNWVSAFHHYDAKQPKAIELALYTGRVGQGRAVEFMAFVDMWRNLPSLDAIIADPMHARVPAANELSILYATCIGLASKATVANFDRIVKYANRLEAGGLGEFGVLLCRDSGRRDAKIYNTRAWIEMSTGPVGHLMQGRAD